MNRFIEQLKGESRVDWATFAIHQAGKVAPFQVSPFSQHRLPTGWRQGGVVGAVDVSGARFRQGSSCPLSPSTLRPGDNARAPFTLFYSRPACSHHICFLPSDSWLYPQLLEPWSS